MQSPPDLKDKQMFIHNLLVIVIVICFLGGFLWICKQNNELDRQGKEKNEKISQLEQKMQLFEHDLHQHTLVRFSDSAFISFNGQPHPLLDTLKMLRCELDKNIQNCKK